MALTRGVRFYFYFYTHFELAAVRASIPFEPNNNSKQNVVSYLLFFFLSRLCTIDFAFPKCQPSTAALLTSFFVIHSRFIH